MRGDVGESPFVSVLLDPRRAAGSPDAWLRTIATGQPGYPGVSRAPNLLKFKVPANRLIGPRPENLLSIQETEMVFLGDDLAEFLVRLLTNPF